MNITIKILFNYYIEQLIYDNYFYTNIEAKFSNVKSI